ncbi:MAG: hypothetical protein ACRDON_09000 [Gaiellaceae bacterium]
MRAEGWPWFWAWGLAGGLVLFALLTGFSIGLFLLPLAVVALVLVARRARGWPEGLGVLAGVAAVCLSVGGLQLAADGGLDPRPWLAVGAALGALAVGGYMFLRRRTGSAWKTHLSRGETVALALAVSVAALGLTLFFTGLGSGEDVEVGTVTVEQP